MVGKWIYLLCVLVGKWIYLLWVLVGKWIYLLWVLVDEFVYLLRGLAVGKGICFLLVLVDLPSVDLGW